MQFAHGTRQGDIKQIAVDARPLVGQRRVFVALGPTKEISDACQYDRVELDALGLLDGHYFEVLTIAQDSTQIIRPNLILDQETDGATHVDGRGPLRPGHPAPRA